MKLHSDLSADVLRLEGNGGCDEHESCAIDGLAASNAIVLELRYGEAGQLLTARAVSSSGPMHR